MRQEAATEGTKPFGHWRLWRKRPVHLDVTFEDAEFLLDMIACRLAALSVVNREDHIQLIKITGLRAKVAAAIGRGS